MASELEMKLYPSGFFGSSSVPQTEEKTDMQKAAEIANGNLITREVSLTSSVGVNEYWENFSARNDVRKTLEFKEEAILLGLRLIPNVSFGDWVEIQTKSPYFTDNHGLYLVEWFKTARYQARPALLPQSWIALLRAGMGTAKKTDKKEILARSYHRDYRGFLDGSEKMHDLIYSTISGAGFSSFLTSLNILYGHR